MANYNHTGLDCVAVAILTHGDWEIYRRDDNTPAIADYVVARDGPVMLQKLTDPFRHTNCHESLHGKPKLFFIQVCRRGVVITKFVLFI